MASLTDCEVMPLSELLGLWIGGEIDLAQVQWVDVLPTTRQLVQAHEAECRYRKVEARLWLTRAAEKPYELEITLSENGEVLDVWRSAWSSRAVNQAIGTYTSSRANAERFLEGWPASDTIRPSWARQSKGKGPST